MINILLLSLLIIFGIQIVFFIFASAFKTDKVTDLAYGMTFVILSWILLIYNKMFTLTNIILAIMVTFWGVRLAGYLFYRILKTKKDERFNGIREHFWKFAMFWTFQTVLIFIIMLPIIFFMTQNPLNKISIISIIGFFIIFIRFFLAKHFITFSL
jgi:steroid 5-alpha reductase family enzyme